MADTIRLNRSVVPYQRNTPVTQGSNFAGLLDAWNNRGFRQAYSGAEGGADAGILYENGQPVRLPTVSLGGFTMGQAPSGFYVHRNVPGGYEGMFDVDYLNPQGGFVGGGQLHAGKDGIAKFIDSAIPIVAGAMIGGGALGAFNIGPMAQPGGFFNPGVAPGAGAGGAGAAGGVAGFAGDPTAWGYGLAEGAGGGATVAGAGGAGGAFVPATGALGAGAAAGGAGGAGAAAQGGLMDIIKTALGAGSGTTGWASLIAPAMSAVGGFLNYNAAGRASDAMINATDRGLAENRRQFDTVMKLLSPYIQAGNRGIAAYQALSGAKGPAAQQAAVKLLEESPEYRTLVSEGEEAILANASATGGLRGGNTQHSLAEFRPKLLTSLIDRQLGRYGGLATMGQNSAAGAATAALNTGTNNANLMQQAGAAQAGGIVAGANAITNAIGGIGGFFTGYGQGVTPPNPAMVAQPARAF